MADTTTAHGRPTPTTIIHRDDARLPTLIGGAWLICTFVAALLGIAGPVNAAEQGFAPLFPFTVSQGDLFPDNVTNFSHLLDKPAGKAGFITAHEGSFYTGDGKRIRFFGVNFCYNAAFPSHADAEKLALQLARFGINLVRFHNIERYEAPDGLFQAGVFPRRIDPDQLDNLDYFVAQLKKNGIYVNFNLKTSRTVQPQEGFPLSDKRPGSDRGLDIFHPDVAVLHREHIRELLTHRNPYTGHRYAEEPSLVQVELNNEDGLFYTWNRGELDKTPDDLVAPLEQQWTAWLARKYGTTAALRAAWGDSSAPARGLVGLPEGESLEIGVRRLIWTEAGQRTPICQSDYVDFIWDTEQAFFTGMYQFIKEELGAKNLVAGTQITLSPPSIQAQLDYVDAHMYWAHPQTTTPSSSNQWSSFYVENRSLVNHDGGGPLSMAARLRVEGKPFTLSEYNHPAPNSYGSEAFVLACAYGAFQDWDGITVFDWSLSRDYWPMRITNYFNIKGHTVKQATLPAATAMLLRGDVQPGVDVVQIPLTDATQKSLMAERKTNMGTNYNAWSRGVPTTLPLRYRMTRTLDAITPGVTAKIPSSSGLRHVTDTEELMWDRTQTDRGVVTIDTSRSKAVVGYGAGRCFDLHEVTIEPGNTRLDGWSTITLTLHDGESFAGPFRALLTATGYSENTGMLLTPLTGTRATIHGSWGSSPVRVEGIPADIELTTSADRVQVYALRENGERMTEVPVRNTDTGSAFAIGPDYRTLWYEVIVR
jgi:hypothetical protein